MTKNTLMDLDPLFVDIKSFELAILVFPGHILIKVNFADIQLLYHLSSIKITIISLLIFLLRKQINKE